MKRKLRKLNEILLISIFVLTALLAAVVGLKAYDSYVTGREQEEKEFAEVLARNAEAQNRVLEMETEIQELTKNRQELEKFITNLQTAESGVPTDAAVSDNSSVSADAAVETSVSGDWVSGNGIGSDNTVSGNFNVSDNTISVYSSVSGNTISGNDTVSGNDFLRNGFLVSGNGSVSDNSTVSGDLLSVFQENNGYVQPEMTLEERRQLHTSLEETMEVNQEDLIRLAESQIDFSDKKIACLGDSITAASNLDSEEDYQQYSYPANLKELLGAEEVYNLGIGGSSIGRYWADAFVDRYQDIPEDADIIIVMGGTNDGFCAADKEFGSLNERAYRTFCGDLDELMRGLRENYPDADIFFATPLPNILHDYLMSERDYLLPQKNFADVILTLAQEYDYEVIDLYNSNLLDSHDVDIVEGYMPDGVHGNHDGYRILAEHFAAELVRYYEEDVWEEKGSVSDNSVEEQNNREQISDNSVDERNDREQISDNSADERNDREQISDNAADERDKKEQISGNSTRAQKRKESKER